MPTAAPVTAVTVFHRSGSPAGFDHWAQQLLMSAGSSTGHIPNAMSDGVVGYPPTMPVVHVLAVVHVSDIDTSRRWYTNLFGRPEDNNPMPTLVEWQVLPGAWVQVFHEPDRAGTDELNVAVDDLESHIAHMRERGLEPSEISEASKGVRLSRISDPDGNVIGLIGGFRVNY